jgi:hypothetical protein
VPALVVIVLLAALVFRLSSCASDAKTGGASPVADTPASPSASSASASPAADTSPVPPYSAKEIKSIYSRLGLTVAEIRDAGDYTMVHYYKPTGVPDEIISRFDWFDRETGARDYVFGGTVTEAFEIKADKSFTVLTTGVSYDEGIRKFPEIIRAFYTDADGAVKFTRIEEKYLSPLGKSYTIGTDRRACLTEINVNPGFVSLGFGPQSGNESEFYAMPASIPKMDIVVADGIATVTLYKTILAEGAEMLPIKENPLCSVNSMRADGDTFILTLQLSDSVSRYNVSVETSPESGLPYAVLAFTSAVCDYPAGW